MDSRNLPAGILEENIDAAGSLLSSFFPPCPFVSTVLRINDSMSAPAEFLTKIVDIILRIIKRNGR